MTPDEQLELVNNFYAMNGAGDPAAQDLVTDDFVLAIPSYLPFGGDYRGKGALRQAIPAVVQSIGRPKLNFIATTVGGDYAVKVVEFTFEGAEELPTQVAELLRFRGNQICEIHPFYSDPGAFIAAAERRQAAGSAR